MDFVIDRELDSNTDQALELFIASGTVVQDHGRVGSHIRNIDRGLYDIRHPILGKAWSLGFGGYSVLRVGPFGGGLVFTVRTEFGLTIVAAFAVIIRAVRIGPVHNTVPAVFADFPIPLTAMDSTLELHGGRVLGAFVTELGGLGIRADGHRFRYGASRG
jgi:hypothetical protein